jgi:WD40 repeat protein
MDGMVMLMTPDERAIALEYYALDENALLTPQECYSINVNLHGASDVAGPAYALRSVSSVPIFWGRFPLLQSALCNAAKQFWPTAASMHLRDPQSQHPVKFFFFSITEEEISRAVFWRDSACMPSSVHVFQRTLQASNGADLQQMPADSAELKNYIDMSSDKTSADLTAAQLLKEQQMMIALSLKQSAACLTSFPPLEWQDGKGIDPSHPQHAAYLNQFAEVALNRLLDSTDEARERLAVEPHAGMAEAIFHLKFAMQRARKFAHSQETQHVTTKLRDYLASFNAPRHAFVIHGASGSGKTYLMAEAAEKEARALTLSANAFTSGNAVIVRFLGTSPSSSNLTALLASLCSQLHSISPNAARLPTSDDEDSVFEEDEDSSDDASGFPRSDDVEKLKEYFQRAMKTWQKGRLTVFLDSLDQLDDTCGGRKLGWLPTHDLSPNVRLVISTLPDEVASADGKPFACLSILQKRYIGSLSDSAMAEVQPVDNVRSLLLHLLKLRQHKLSDAQLQVLEAAIKLSPRTQTPLVVTILAVRFGDWPSHQDFPPDNKNPDGSLFIDTSSVRALIIQDFKSFEAKHGIELVRAALSFVTLAKDGVSETELSEILSLDDDVLASVYEWWVPPVRTLPTNPLTMLLADLKPYLTMRGAASGSGGLMIRWYHRQFWEAAEEYFLRDVAERRRRHAQLAQFFSGTWAERSKPYNEKLKTAVQKKVAGEVSGNRRVRAQPLCLREGRNIFATKGDASAVNERRCREAAHHFILAGMLSEAADELCSFEGICARARCGEGFVLLQQLMALCHRIREGVRQRDVQAAQALHQLLRVEHYARWLQRNMSTIAANPVAETITSCSFQPTISISREDVKSYFKLTSAGVKFDLRSSFRSFVLSPSQDFDSCRFELKHHKNSVNCVAYNFDCCLLASASVDKTVAIWNMNTGMVECVLKGHTKEVQSVAWCMWPGNVKLLASGSRDKTIRLWDIAAQQQVAQLTGHTDFVRSVAFDPSGKYLASGSRDKTIRLWDLAAQAQVAQLTGHARAVFSVAFDSSGKYLASGSRDKTVRLWDVATKQQIAKLTGHTRTIWSVAFDSSGKYLASGSDDRTVRLWDLTAQTQVAELTDHTLGVNSVAFDPRGKYLASGSWDNSVRMWDVATKQQVAELTGHVGTVWSVAFDSSGKYLASGSYDRTIRLWDVAAQMQVTRLTGNTDDVYSVAFDSSGKYLASGSADKTIRLWDVATQNQVAELTGHTEGVLSVAFDSSGKYLASGSDDTTVRLWDVATQNQVAELTGHTEGVFCVAFDSSGKYLASGSSTVRLWDVATQQQVAELTGHTDWVHSVAFDPSGKYLASGSRDKTVRLWDVATQQQVAEFRHTYSVNSVVFDSSGKYLASGSWDKIIRLWDVATQQQVAELTGHTNWVNTMAFDSSGKYLASGSHDKTVRLWDVGLVTFLCE